MMPLGLCEASSECSDLRLLLLDDFFDRHARLGLQFGFDPVAHLDFLLLQLLQEVVLNGHLDGRCLFFQLCLRFFLLLHQHRLLFLMRLHFQRFERVFMTLRHLLES